jgi:ATP-dependent helicase HrpB
MALPPLPIDAVLPELKEALRAHDEAVLEAPPGAGKTTRVPLELLGEDWLGAQRIVMLEPRRLAARAAAEYMAGLLGEAVGGTVGYRMRHDTRIGPGTRIEVLTEGVLTRVLQNDPALDGVGLLIFDEFHERSLQADLGLALSLQGRALFRDTRPLKLLVMSATLDGARVSSLLGEAPVILSAGRTHPVDVVYGAPWAPSRDLEREVRRTVLRALTEQEGSVLVFLPGQAEIRRVHERLAAEFASRPGVDLMPLYGELGLEIQRRVIEPAPPGRRKVVLATAIAETSLTIEGIRVVVDAGLSRLPVFDPATGMTRLHTRRLSRAASVQRMGRAGRVAPGVCYRLWSAAQQDRLTPYTPPEILQADLADLALQLLHWGVQDPAELQWLDPPPSGAYAQAVALLERLGVVSRDQGGCARLTTHGRAMEALPVHPRLAHLLLLGQHHGLSQLACELAAILSGREPLPGGEADIGTRLALLRGTHPAQRTAHALLQGLRRELHRFRRLCRSDARDPVEDPEHPRWIGFLLACAYPERIALRRAEAGADYRLSNGRAARLSRDDPLQRSPWLAVARIGGRQGETQDRIFVAAELDPALFDGPLAHQVRVEERVEWDHREGRLRAERQHRIGALIRARSALQSVPAETRRRVVLELIRDRGLGLLPWTAELRQWQARVMLLRRTFDEDPVCRWPQVSDARLLATLEDWLGPYLDRIGHIHHLASLDLANCLQVLLPWPLPRELERLAPSRYTVPSGARVRLDYSETPPILAVRLQEMFGCRQTPRIAQGRVPLKLHLLSPARRALQITQDLDGFWRSGYAQVRKEMRGRYPKHHWPEDPLSASPSRARN